MRRLALCSIVLLAGCGSQTEPKPMVYRDAKGAIIPEADARRLLAEARSQERQHLDPLAQAAAQEELIRRRNGWKPSGTAERMRGRPAGPGPLDAMFRDEASRRGTPRRSGSSTR